MKATSEVISAHTLILLALASASAACSGSSFGAQPADSGSVVGAGGTTESADGATGSGGAGSGTTTDSGGTGSAGAGTGGNGVGDTTNNTGGATSNTGGATSGGGATTSGGSTGAGGVTGGGGRRGTGGARATGGSTVGTGGASTAGVTGAGGGASVGGVTSVGGAIGTGGVSMGGAMSTGGTTQSGATYTGASVQLVGNRILDVAGNPIAARGPEDVVASTGQTKDIDQAAGLGANAMRMLFTLDSANGMTPAGFDTLLARAVAQHMLVWVSLYVWDTAHSYVIASGLGGGNFYSLTGPAGAACSKTTPASCYLAVWSRQWLKDLMSKYKSNVIIDAGQEFISPGDASTEAVRVAWASAAKTNIQFFRDQGYTNPLEIMANYQGRDLYCIVEYGKDIRAADKVVVDGNPQTMFGWQAYWGTSDNYYPRFQGALLLGQSSGSVTGPQAIHQFAATQAFPIQIGIDNYASDTNIDYQAEIDQASADGMSWLWWSWKNGTVDCPASGSTCQSYVTTSQNGFAGAKRLTN